MEVTARAIIIENRELMTFYREKIINGKKVTYYAIPGGHVEKGETPEDTVVRELKEELNIDIKIIRELGTININGIKEIYYLCERLSGEPILGGEELERNCPENYYELKYYPIDKIDESGIKSLELIKGVINGWYIFK